MRYFSNNDGLETITLASHRDAEDCRL